MIRTLVFMAVLLLIPLLSFGQSPNWNTKVDQAGGTCADMTPGRTCYFDFTGTTDSVVLGIEKCSTVSFAFNPNEDGTSTGATVYIRSCSENSVSANHCSIVAVDVNGDGMIDGSDEQTLNGTTGRRGMAQVPIADPYVYTDISVNGSSDDGRVTAICH